MIKLITAKRLYLLLAFILALMVVLFFGNFAFVKANSGGYDFFTHWYATRIYIKDGVNPYSEISIARTAEAINQALEPADNEEFRFTAPLFAIIPLTPFSLVGEFKVARALWMTFQEVAWIAIVWLLSDQFKIKKKISVILILIVLCGFSLPSISAILNGSQTLTALFFFVLAVSLITRQSDEAAGLLLNFSLIKAELFYPGVLLLLIWAAIRGRKRILGWFIGTLILLMGFSILLIPDWSISYLRVIISHFGINPLEPLPSLANPMTLRLTLLKNLVITTLLILEWIVVRFQGKKKIIWNIGLLFTLLPWFGVGMHIEHTTLYLPAMIIITLLFLSTWNEKISFSILLLPIFLFILSWIFSGLFFSGISIVLSRIILYVVQPLTILVFYYWVRWWVLRSEKFSIPSGIENPS